METARRQLHPKHGTLRAFEQTEWAHVEVEAWLVQQAYVGYVYGDSVRDTWEAAPEAGIKWFVGNDVFVYAQVEYQFFFRSGAR